MVKVTVGTQQVYGLKLQLADEVYQRVALLLIVGSAVNDDTLL